MVIIDEQKIRYLFFRLRASVCVCLTMIRKTFFLQINLDN